MSNFIVAPSGAGKSSFIKAHPKGTGYWLIDADVCESVAKVYEHMESLSPRWWGQEMLHSGKNNRMSGIARDWKTKLPRCSDIVILNL